MESARIIVVSIDSSAHSLTALKWCLRNIWRANDSLHLITVLHPLTLSAYPVTPVITSTAVSAIVQQTELQRKHEEAEAKLTLQEAADIALSSSNMTREQLHKHALPAAGGASGVANSIVEYAKVVEAAVVVVGSRGLGSFKRSMMSLVGLGSVSDYCVHNLPMPVVVVHNGCNSTEAEGAAQAAGPRKVLLAPDGSQQSQLAMEWAIKNLLKPNDQLHIISVALPQPFPVLDEGSATIAALEAEEWRQTNTQALADAQLVCECIAKQVLQSHAVPAENIWQQALTTEGEGSDVGATICSYAKQQGVEVVVVGSRGLGPFKRSMMHLVGLGSVGDYCVHNLQSAVVVVKGQLGAAHEGDMHVGAMSNRNGAIVVAANGTHAA